MDGMPSGILFSMRPLVGAARWRLRYAALGCLAPEPRTARWLDAEARLPLWRLAALLLGDSFVEGTWTDELRDLTRQAADVVNAVMVRNYGAHGAHWWRLPRDDPFLGPLNVPFWWGIEWAAIAYRSESAWRTPAKPVRDASLRALELAEQTQDWTGYWRLGSCREVATETSVSAAMRRFERAELAVGAPSVLIVQHRGLPQLATPCGALPLRLVHSAPAATPDRGPSGDAA